MFTKTLIILLVLSTLATAAHAQALPESESTTTTFTNPFSFPLQMPESKPHKIEINDTSELRETAYTQKDEQPVSPSVFSPVHSSLEVPNFAAEDAAQPPSPAPQTDTPFNRPAF